VPVTADRRQIVTVRYRYHTPGTHSPPAHRRRDVITRPEIVVGVEVTWTEIGERVDDIVLQLVEERLLLKLMMMMMLMMMGERLVLVR